MRTTAKLAVLLISCLIIWAQTKAPVTPKDYGQFETLAATGLSPDGKWMAYGINRSNRENELRITNMADGTNKVVAFGSQPVFSSDSRWVGYSIGVSEAQQEKLRKHKKPERRKLGLMNLANGEQTTVDAVESFVFSPNGAYLAIRRYPPEKKDPPPPDPATAADTDATPSTTVIVRNLANGRETAFGNVSEFAWQDVPKTGRLLALAISTEDKAGNGVQLFDPETGALRVLDSSSSIYSGLAWRKKSADLAVLRSQTDDQHDGPTQIALAWAHLTEPSKAGHQYDPTADTKFPAGLRMVSYRKPSWSETGEIVFLGLANWDKKPPAAKKATPATDGEATHNPDAPTKAAKEDEDPAAVDVWHWRDAGVS